METRPVRSDELRYTMFQNDGRVSVRREAHETLDPSRIAPAVEASIGSVMIRESFTWSGSCSVTLCSNIMKYQEYLNILGDHVHPSMDFYFPDGFGIFQKVSCRARLVQGPRGIIFSYGMASRVCRFKPFQKFVGPTGEGLVTLTSSYFFS